MPRIRSFSIAALAVAVAGPHLGACSLVQPGFDTTGSLPKTTKHLAAVTSADKECLTRAMYFESNRTSEEGLFAVGTVVMNRLEAEQYPASICGVVGQKRQFAPGVLSKPMRDKEREKAAEVADALLSGERHGSVGSAMFFHTAGLRFPYNNMHYVAFAGGNAFYEKRPRARDAAPAPVQVAHGAPLPSFRQALVQVAHAAPVRARPTALAELGPASNICRVAAVAGTQSPG
ncbi:cell wall hydrolase [Methylobacterium oryzihabitans]|uniref:Cell wall hydrolase n=1 Tax=Methylobacterium oryzihabitans TaxID=2499852 RepID=A0A3S2V3G8_9HYPH|nr:cell wall hydrolase [Methylobacterium oryzihabitans]RVU14449.1 cell wall hydrolase [Methylobacterium oryzihabitans]